MDVMILSFIAVLVVYFTAVFLTVEYTVDKLGARSGLFGAGLVNIVIGFAMYAIVSKFGILVGEFGESVFWYDTPDVFYYVPLFVFLAMGLSGTVMVAVDLLKAVNELSGYVSRVDAKKPAVQNDADGSGKIPAWKRIQMEQEAQSKE